MFALPRHEVIVWWMGHIRQEYTKSRTNMVSVEVGVVSVVRLQMTNICVRCSMVELQEKVRLIKKQNKHQIENLKWKLSESLVD